MKSNFIYLNIFYCYYIFNLKFLMEKEFLKNEHEENKEILIIDDFYESLSDQKKNLISQLKFSRDGEDNQIENLKKISKCKFNKIKLLLYQKFLNIFFATLSSIIKKQFKYFLDKLKLTKMIKSGYKINSEKKVNKFLEYFLIIVQVPKIF